MDVTVAIGKRRAYRALEPVEISDEVISELGKTAQLTASCYNKQPWRFVFVKDGDALKKMHGALSKGNEWAYKASMIAAVFGKKDNDCVIREREYYLFDIGMAVSAMVLRATELGLVAHPIAGYDPQKVKGVLGIPEDNMVITLVIIGKKSQDLSGLNEHQKKAEGERPERIDLSSIFSVDTYDKKLEG